jgi:ankyrin repeat protein
MKFIEVVRTSNQSLLKKLLDAGLSPNPCNSFGESILHMLCRRGDHKLLQIFLDYGCSVQICDDFGRTPLHDACWTTTPCYKCVELLLNKDRWLLQIVDCRGATPLSYVRKEHWNDWKEFLDRQKDVWWPQIDLSRKDANSLPELVRLPPHSVPLPDPPGAPSHEYAKELANGSIETFSTNASQIVGRLSAAATN